MKNLSKLVDTGDYVQVVIIAGTDQVYTRMGIVESFDDNYVSLTDKGLDKAELDKKIPIIGERTIIDADRIIEIICIKKNYT